MGSRDKRTGASKNEWIRGAILMYWSIFWLFNIIDKVIGGSQFLWVGRDRFAHDDHKEYFAGEAALKASGKDNTMNQF